MTRFIFSPDASAPGCLTPVFEEFIHAGFPSPAEGYSVNSLDLNEYLIHNKSATFFLYASGDSMVDAGIDDGDMLIVDRSVEAHNGSIVIAELNGEFTVKQFYHSVGTIELRPANEHYPIIYIREEDEFVVIGVVCWTVKKNR